MDEQSTQPRLVVVIYEGVGAIVAVHASHSPQIEVIDVADLREAGVSEYEVENILKKAREGLEKIY